MIKDILFNNIIKDILVFEGGYSNDKNDPGGETNFGISKKAYPNIGIKYLNEKQAKDIYYNDYWLKCKCHKLPGPIAIFLFDTSINIGQTKAIKILQKASNVKRDGIIGPITLASIKSRGNMQIIKKMAMLRIMFYMRLSNFNKYGNGWLQRTIGISILSFLKGSRELKKRVGDRN